MGFLYNSAYTSTMKYTKKDIGSLGTILEVWAHPDDETWMSAGVMAAALEAGQRVVCVTATKGDAGQSADDAKRPHDRVGPTRERELSACLAILGGPEHRWLNYKDGMLARTDATKPVKEIAAIIKEVKPDTIITFGPDGFTGHLDHKTIYTWTHEALKRSGHSAELWVATEATEKHQTSGQVLHSFANFYCNTTAPFTVGTDDVDVYFELTDTLMQKKMAALKAHKSQTHHIFADPDALKALYAHAQGECFMKIV